MRVTILGCGTSGGVPMLGLGWGDCDKNEPKNRRRRSSIFIEINGNNILIDTSPDCREQLLDADINHIDAVLYTHAHADHCHGIDDLRWICHAMNSPINVFSDKNCIESIINRFNYAFCGCDEIKPSSYYKPVLIPNIIYGDFNVKDIAITSFYQNHGHGMSLGYRIGDFAYSTDVWQLDDNAFEILAGVKTWVVDALQIKPHPTHSHLERTLGWIKKINPDLAILTHMNIYMDYRSLLDNLPNNIIPAYDGMTLDIVF